MKTLNSLMFALIFNEKVVVKYYLSAHNGVVGVAGSNPVVPTLFIYQNKRTGYILYPITYSINST